MTLRRIHVRGRSRVWVLRLGSPRRWEFTFTLRRSMEDKAA